MSDNWSTEELEASVKAYVEMLEKHDKGEKFTKTSYYRKLSKRFGRSTKAYEFRMQNISYVFNQQGKPWLKGLKPLKNVGAHVYKQIENFLESSDVIIKTTTDSVLSESPQIVEITEKNKNPSKATYSKKEIFIKQLEDELVNRYKKYLISTRSMVLKKHFIPIIDEGITLETDGWIEETKTLIEAKSKSTRENIRMAIGQLYDYQRHLELAPKSLAVLLPNLPSDDLIGLLFSQKIDIIYEEKQSFVIRKSN